MEEKFTPLCNEPGYRGLLPLLSSWNKVAKKISLGASPIVLSNLFLELAKGYDIGNLISDMATYLKDKHLLFPGLLTNYIFYLNYSNPQDPDFTSLTALTRVIDKDLNKFGKTYGGVLAIDISEWVEKGATSEKKFLDFLGSIGMLDDSTLAVFIDIGHKGRKADSAFSLIATRTRLERYDVYFKDKDEAMEYFESILSHLGFSLLPDAKEALSSTISEILSIEDFQGPLTIKQLAEDVVYGLYKGDEPLENSISKKEISDYLPGGKWLKNYAARAKYSLGLVGGAL